MALFGRKKEGFRVPETIPVQPVISLRQQGSTDEQIIQQLQQQGYKSHQIFDALSQADMAVSGAPAQPGPIETSETMPYPQEDMQYARPVAAQPARQQQMAQPSVQPMTQPKTESPSGLERERIEEVVEALIEEKWTDLTENVMKVIEWKDSAEAKISKIESSIEEIRGEFKELRSAILGKISDYDKNITDVGTDLKAMQKVFKDIIPTLTENVAELGRITGGMKSAPKKPQKA